MVGIVGEGHGPVESGRDRTARNLLDHLELDNKL